MSQNLSNHVTNLGQGSIAGFNQKLSSMYSSKRQGNNEPLVQYDQQALAGHTRHHTQLADSRADFLETMKNLGHISGVND